MTRRHATPPPSGTSSERGSPLALPPLVSHARLLGILADYTPCSAVGRVGRLCITRVNTTAHSLPLSPAGGPGSSPPLVALDLTWLAGLRYSSSSPPLAITRLFSTRRTPPAPTVVTHVLHFHPLGRPPPLLCPHRVSPRPRLHSLHIYRVPLVGLRHYSTRPGSACLNSPVPASPPLGRPTHRFISPGSASPPLARLRLCSTRTASHPAPAFP